MYIIKELLKEVRDDQKKTNEILTKHGVSLSNLDKTVEGNADLLVSLDKNVERNTADLEVHIKRTDILEDLHRDNQSLINSNKKTIETHRHKIKLLEEPARFKQLLKKKYISILTIVSLTAGAIVGIIKVFDLF